jgi:hypothetical protein
VFLNNSEVRTEKSNTGYSSPAKLAVWSRVSIVSRKYQRQTGDAFWTGRPQEDLMRTGLKTLAMLGTILAGTVGFAAAQDGRYYDRDDYGYQKRYYDHDGFRRGMHEAREFGFRDGSAVAREDSFRGKPFNPNPRGRFDDADHGYRREFGSKHEYREHYREAYREAYQRSYRGNEGYYR